MTDKYDPKRLTPTFLKGIFNAQFELIAKHEEIKATLYEMMASLAYHAPLVRPCEVRKYTLGGVAIAQPTHWLVYASADKHRVRAHADGTLTEPSVPPKPIGFMIPTGRNKVSPRDDTSEPTYLALHGKRVLGEWGAARCVSEIIARQ